jgi:NAD(P)-dependent dehydrogenase (short-subunit alcohol dehydrogenase family)
MTPKRLLLIGASRGPGFALAEEYLRRGWLVVATERGRDKSKLHELASRSDHRLETENVDIVYPGSKAALNMFMRSFAARQTGPGLRHATLDAHAG